MKKPISGHEILGKLLENLSHRTSPTWIQVLATQANRDLLSLIAREKPQSVSELSELAGRAQPNVSRSLAALAEAGLITLESEGRRSIPRLTALALEKVSEMGLPSDRPATSETESEPTAKPSSPFALEWDESPPIADSEQLEGTVIFFGDSSSEQGRRGGDIAEFVLRLTDHWWRMLYRADAPFSIASFQRPGKEAEAACEVRSAGNRIEIALRIPPGERPVRSIINRDSFETHLLKEIVTPAVKRLRMRYLYGHRAVSNLREIEEMRSYPRELSFFRTMGALGLSTDQLDDDKATSIRSLVSEIGDEDVRLDFASAVLADSLEDSRQWIASALDDHNGMSIPDLAAFRAACACSSGSAGKKPWQMGIALAKAVRQEIGLAPDRPLNGIECLVRAFGSEEKPKFSPEPPGSLLAFQSTKGKAPIIAMPYKGPTASPFIMARAIGDYIAFGSQRACVTELYTDRQAVGRAFAAELLAPSEAVVHMVHEDKSTHRIAAHFGVSIDVVRNQFENNA